MENNDRLNEIMKLIFESDVVVVNSVDKDGYPTSRAMLTLNEDASFKEMFFSTNTFSHKIIHFHDNPKASLYFHSPDKFRGVYLQGEMQVCFDQETKNRFWHDGDEKYYRFGKTDPNYCILRFIPNKGNYYCGLRIDHFLIKDGEIKFLPLDTHPEVPEFLKEMYEDYMERVTGSQS